METVSIDQTNVPRPTKLPDWNNFWLIPASSPHLREFVLSAEWSYRDKTLSFELKETPAFSAFDWFSKLPNDTDNEEIIAVCFFDDENLEIARLEFKGLALSGHRCELNDGEEDEDEDNDLIHELILRFQSVKRVRGNQQSLENVHKKFQEVADEEWNGEQKELVTSTILDH